MRSLRIVAFVTTLILVLTGTAIAKNFSSTCNTANKKTKNFIVITCPQGQHIDLEHVEERIWGKTPVKKFNVLCNKTLYKTLVYSALFETGAELSCAQINGAKATIWLKP